MGGYVHVSRRDLRVLCRGFANNLLAHAAAGRDLELQGSRELECVTVMSDALI